MFKYIIKSKQISMFQSAQMPNLCIQKDNNEYLPNHAPFQRICCAHNNLIDNSISNCTQIQLVHANLPLQSHLCHPNLLQKPQFHPIPMHRVQPILACQRRFVPSIVLSFASDVLCCCMGFVPKTSKQAPFHTSVRQSYQQLASPNSSSTLVPFHSLADSIWSDVASCILSLENDYLCSLHTRQTAPMKTDCMRQSMWRIVSYLFGLSEIN